MPEILYQSSDGRLRLELHLAPPPGFVEFLGQVVWGTGSVRYTILDIAEHLEAFPDSRFLALFDRDVLAGTYLMTPRTIRAGGRTCRAFYQSMLAVNPARAREGLGGLLVREVRRHFLLGAPDPVVSYGFVEADNVASVTLLSRAYERWGTFLAVPFTRWSPADDPRVEPLAWGDLPSMADRLAQLYRDHTAWDFSDALRRGGYFLLRQGGAVVAGAQVQLHHWRLAGLEGLVGRLARNLIPRLPFTRRFGNPESFRFAFFGSLYFEPGRERDLVRLLEALLARTGLHTGMLHLDARGPVYGALRRGGGLGFLHSLGVKGGVHLMAGAAHLSEEELAELRRRPLCLSILDSI